MQDIINVTVIATGFDRAEEEHAALMKRAVRQPLEGEMPAPPTRASHHSDAAPVYSRRSAASAAALQASAPPTPAQSQLPHVRERITFPSSQHTETDWDIPTYQRRNAG